MKIESENRYPQEADDNSDLKKFLADILKIWPYILCFVVFNLIIANIMIRKANPTYQVEATLEIKRDKGTEPSDLFQNFGIKVQNSIENEMAVLNSFTLSLNAIQDLNFNVEYFQRSVWRHYEVYMALPYEVEVDWAHRQVLGAEFDINFTDQEQFSLLLRDGSMALYHPASKEAKLPLDISQLNVNGNYRINQWIEGTNYRFRIVPVSGMRKVATDFSFRLKSDFDLAEQYSKRLKVDILKKESSILSLTMESQTVMKDKAFINKIIQAYQGRELLMKNQTSINTAEFIKEQLKSITDSMVFFEDKLEAYRTSNETFDLKEQGNAVYTRISELQDQSAQNSLKIKYYESTLRYLELEKVDRLVVPSSIGIEEAVLEKLVPELLEVQNKRLRLKEMLSPQNQALKELEFKYTTLMETVRENLKRSLSIAKISAADLDTRMDKLSTEMDALPQVERNLLSIQRQFSISENIYTYLLQKRSEAQITSASNVPSSQVLDLSRQKGGMLSPVPLKSYILALALGILIPVCFVFVRNAFDNRIYDVKLLDKRSASPVLGVVYRNPGKEGSNVVINAPRSYVSENFRNIRASIQFLYNQTEGLVIAITSSKAGEGKTFCSLNMAAVYALGGKKAVLVGMDLRMPRLAENLNLVNDIGVSNYLIGNRNLKSMIKPSGFDNMDILLSGPLPPNPAELIALPTFREMVNELKTMYDVIILDCPPAGFVSETIDIFKVADLNFYIFRHLFSEWGSIDYLNNLVDKGLIKRSYVIYNDMENLHKNEYGYGYGYHETKQGLSWWKKLFSRKIKG